jgi:hypothetical protein
MDTSKHHIAQLFEQLGLPSSPAEIDAFVARHRLPEGVSLCKAPFWNPAQAQFLAQALADDSDWAEAADALAVRLS